MEGGSARNDLFVQADAYYVILMGLATVRPSVRAKTDGVAARIGLAQHYGSSQSVDLSAELQADAIQG